MSAQNIDIRNTNPNSRDEQLGRFTRRGELVVPDSFQTFPYFKKIMVTVAGNVAYENQFGESVIIPLCQPGTEYYHVGRRILSTGTTATGIHVYTSE